MGLAAPHCHPAPPGAQGNSWGCLGPTVAKSVAIQRPKRAKSAPKRKGPKPCKSTPGGSRDIKQPQPTAQITQRGLWGVCELHRTTRGTSNKPHNPIVQTPSRKSRLITRPPLCVGSFNHNKTVIETPSPPSCQAPLCGALGPQRKQLGPSAGADRLQLSCQGSSQPDLPSGKLKSPQTVLWSWVVGVLCMLQRRG